MNMNNQHPPRPRHGRALVSRFWILLTLLASLTLVAALPRMAYASVGIDPNTISDITVTSFPCPATSNGLTTISGQITFSTAPAAGDTLNLAVYVHIPPSSGGDSKFHLITTPGFNANYNGTQTQATIIGIAGQKTYNYMVSFTAVPLANSYRIQVGSPYTEDQSQTYTKSPSVSCGGTPIIVPPTTDTPELSSTELVATGVVAAAGLVLLRRRRKRNV